MRGLWPYLEFGMMQRNWESLECMDEEVRVQTYCRKPVKRLFGRIELAKNVCWKTGMRSYTQISVKAWEFSLFWDVL